MNVALWIAAGLLAVVYAVGSVSKLFLPKEKLAAHPSGRWVEDFDARTVQAIGGVEALAAVGLILPAALDIAPVLVPLAATGAALLMTGAVATRVRRREKVVVLDLTYLALALFVAVGRFGPESFT
ncbi:DoxX family protein [Streptomyces sp. WMMC500]|uniref:DoxX family protein n=1 Tax=Streptomyces sp. WMMC500 TaxID=3015154 RepID=UPI00248B4FB8|nr:DoxX family protein [Streptomyces sp. WMMC500]WBB58138.1 DoxX family protein [Streptomyces sp. WMMC500]